MKRFVVPILLALYVTLFGGWFIADLNAEPNAYQEETFTVEPPAGLVKTVYPIEDGNKVTVYEAADGTLGFQVFTMPYDGSLTADALKAELPDLVIERPQKTTIDGAPALAFDSRSDIGDTFEVWFVHDGLLYQVMTYRGQEAWLTDILTTWRFR